MELVYLVKDLNGCVGTLRDQVLEISFGENECVQSHIKCHCRTLQGEAAIHGA